LRGRVALLGRHALQELDCFEVLFQVLALHAWRDEVAGRRARDRPSQKAVRQHAVRNEPDAQLARSRQDLLVDEAAREGILDLQGGYRMDRMRAPEVIDPDFRYAQVPDLAFLDRICSAWQISPGDESM